MKNKFRLGRLIAELLIVLGVLVITISSTLLKDAPYRDLLYWSSLILLVAAMCVVFACCRCPRCGEVVFKNLIGAKTCPKCGARLFPDPGGAPRRQHRKKKR